MASTELSAAPMWGSLPGNETTPESLGYFAHRDGRGGVSAVHVCPCDTLVCLFVMAPRLGVCITAVDLLPWRCRVERVAGYAKLRQVSARVSFLFPGDDVCPCDAPRDIVRNLSALRLQERGCDLPAPLPTWSWAAVPTAPGNISPAYLYGGLARALYERVPRGQNFGSLFGGC